MLAGSLQCYEIVNIINNKTAYLNISVRNSPLFIFEQMYSRNCVYNFLWRAYTLYTILYYSGCPFVSTNRKTVGFHRHISTRLVFAFSPFSVNNYPFLKYIVPADIYECFFTQATGTPSLHGGAIKPSLSSLVMVYSISTRDLSYHAFYIPPHKKVQGGQLNPALYLNSFSRV